MPVYNKLVRDRIPEIIEKSGKKFTVETLDHDRYVLEMKKKLTEELKEYHETANNDEALEELADMLELIYSLAEVHGGTIEELEQIRKQKAEKRGGFKKKLFLIEVED